jgi:hypothetical protein
VKPDLSSWGPMTVLVIVVAVIVVVIGGISVLAGSYDTDFRQWANDLVVLAGAAGVLGVGRGILQGKKEEAASRAAADVLRDPVEAPVGTIDPDVEERDLHDSGRS